MTRLIAPLGRPASRKASTISAWVRGQLSRRLEHHRVAAGQRHGDRAHAEDDRRVPRRDRQDDADRLADRKAIEPGRLEGITSPVIWVVIEAASRIMSAAKPDVEMRPVRRGCRSRRSRRRRSRRPSTARMSAAFSRSCAARPAAVATIPGRPPRRRRRPACASPTEAAAARVAISPVTGSSRSKVRSPPARDVAVGDDQPGLEHGMSPPLSVAP